MGGFFGAVSKQDCVLDLFFGVDYHSHLGTRRGGLAVLAHTAYREAEVAVNNILGKKDRMRYNVIPSVIYSTPWGRKELDVTEWLSLFSLFFPTGILKLHLKIYQNIFDKILICFKSLNSVFLNRNVYYNPTSHHLCVH